MKSEQPKYLSNSSVKSPGNEYRIYNDRLELYHVSLGNADSNEPIGEMFYTIQDGWHLKADNEIMEFVPGERWLIAEQ